MSREKGAGLLIVLFAVCMSFLTTANAKADSSQITVIPDKAGAKVSVIIADTSMSGQNVSVVCYAPGWGGVQSGNYTLVLGYTGGKVSKPFSFDGGGGAVVSISAPNSVKAVQTAAKKVKVTWNKVSGAAGYNVYRSTKKFGTYSKVGTASKASFTDKKIKAGKTYYYKVAASNGANQSDAAKVTVMKQPKIKVKSAKRSAKVSWKKDGSASGYRVYMSAKKKGKYKVAAVVKGKKKVKATVKKLKSGKTYYFKVSAYKEVGKKKIAGKASAVKNVRIK